MLTSIERLIKAGDLVLDDRDPDRYTTYVIAHGYVLLDASSNRITLVQVLHDSNDLVVLFTEGEPEDPQNVSLDEPISIRIYKEINAYDNSL